MDRQLKNFLYTSGALALLGVLLVTLSLDRINDAEVVAAQALEYASVDGSGPATLALSLYERASAEASRATFRLALSATLIPLLLFLNVVRYAQASGATRGSREARKHGFQHPDPEPAAA